MPEFRTRLINSEFDITDHGQEQESLDIASKAAILTAIDIAKGLYANGEANPRIETLISESEEVVARHVVTVCVGDD